ncbi:hypothetical protein GKZ89_11755 [Bacillus mangrovi]|uniref:Uncharacterized protein n=1 Tax=Metabacillus mangrovi TaxID=1491830 RepID=A0A7X2S5K6_9BACI|nr:hypothetical protein [Metabacillus mangrovi]MTH54084.1 hypothetical protein [Metabacillus mangrovi]
MNDSLKAIRESGMQVEFDVDWFIEALDAYYGDGGENLSDERILDIVTMSGVAGEMIQDPK